MVLARLRVALLAPVRVAALASGLALAAPAPGPAQSLPDRLGNEAFWAMVTTFSEPGGNFPSENFLSNETGFQWVLPTLLRSTRPGGAYIGVGPEQNFTYIAALHPRIAFIVDIRRQALLQHLMYKALFELADTRADFLGLLFARPRPRGLNSAATPDRLFAAYDSVAADPALRQQTLARIQHQLIVTHHFALSPADLDGIAHVYDVVVSAGPRLSYGSGPSVASRVLFTDRGAGMSATTAGWANGTIRQDSVVVDSFAGRAAPLPQTPKDRVGSPFALQDGTSRDTVCKGVAGCIARQAPVAMAAIRVGTPSRIGAGLPDYAALMAQTDSLGTERSFLATEANYRTVRDLEARNLLVPIVGDFAGSTALRAVGNYLRGHGAVVTAFYTSNVEQYLFADHVAPAFYANVATLPIDRSSTIIRALVGASAKAPASPFGVGLTSTLESVPDLLAAFAAGRLNTYSALFDLSHQ